MSATKPSQPDKEAPILQGIETAPEIFVDGVASAINGFPISKVLFFQVMGTPGKTDPSSDRRIALRLVMPTASLLQFCRITLENFGNDGDKYEKIATRHVARARTAAKGIPKISDSQYIRRDVVQDDSTSGTDESKVE